VGRVQVRTGGKTCQGLDLTLGKKGGRKIKKEINSWREEKKRFVINDGETDQDSLKKGPRHS